MDMLENCSNKIESKYSYCYTTDSGDDRALFWVPTQSATHSAGV